MSEKTAQYGIRVDALNQARIEFLARLYKLSPTSMAATLLSDAARQRIHEMTHPDAPQTLPVAGNEDQNQ